MRRANTLAFPGRLSEVHGAGRQPAQQEVATPDPAQLFSLERLFQGLTACSPLNSLHP